MAQIPNNLMKNWKDGDTVRAVDYKLERDTIITAYNDTDAKKTDKTGDHQGTWQGLTPSQAGEGVNGGRLDRIESVIVDVRRFGAKGDGIADDTVAIQNAINSLLSTGGTVYLPKGTYRTSAPLNLTSNIKLKGDGWTTTFIKPLNSAVIPTNQGVVQTKDFLPDRNVWDYYSPYPTGLHMGIGLEDICIDGNRANQTTGNGLCIYGGKWTLNRVSVINTAEHGIWTEAGIPVSSTSGDDLEDYINMHESTAETVFISNANKYGWNFRGANDSYINNIQIKSTGWSGFLMDSGATFMTAGLKVGTLHAYGTNVGVGDPSGYNIDIKGVLMADRFYIDSPQKNGLRLVSANHINRVYILNRNGAATVANWGLVIEGSGNTINALKVNDSFTIPNGGIDGGCVWIKSGAERNIIGNINIFGANNAGLATKGLLIEGNWTTINGGNITSLPAGTGLTVSSGSNNIDLIVRSCLVGFKYINTSTLTVNKNTMNLSIFDCTTTEQKDIPYISNENIKIVQTNVNPLQYGNVNHDGPTLINVSGIDYKEKTFTSASNYTLDDDKVTFYLATLNQNTTFDAPTVTQTIGKMLVIRLIQDATGGRTVTWNSAFKTSWANPDSSPGAAFKRSTITFIWEGTFWMEVSRTPWI